MSDPTASAAKPAKKSVLSFLAWWHTDPADIERQVAGYTTLKLWQSARGVSLLLCALTTAVTVVFGRFVKLSQDAIVLEVIVWGTLGFLMFRGKRWAFVTGMLLWTTEKGLLLLGGPSGGTAPIGQIIWWAIYLKAFMLGFRVEGARRQAPVPAARA